MANNIDQLKSLVSRKGGVARTNVFRVKLPTIPGASSEEVNLLCTNVNLPGKQVVTNERRIGMQFQKVPYGYAVTDVNMTFLVMNDYGIKKYFDVWQNLAVDIETQTAGYLRGREGYGKQITIEQLRKGIGLPVFSTPIGLPRLPSEIQNRLPKLGAVDLAQGAFDLDFITNDDVVYSCTLEDAYPVTMNDITLSNDTDGIAELNISIAYTKWTANKTEITSNTERFIQTQIGTALGRAFN